MPQAKAQPRSVFVCWSGARSQTVATAVKALVESALPTLKGRVFVSMQIEKGAPWFDEIVRNLGSAGAGILCLTAENLDSPWVHFEAGALAKGFHGHDSPRVAGGGPPLRNRIFSYIHGKGTASLGGPLSQYQSSTTTAEDTLALLRALEGVLGLRPDAALPARFKGAWARLEKKLKASTVRVEALLPDFEDWFRRKTFEEPLQQCTDQTWVRRYDGVRETQERVGRHLTTVRNAAPRYQADVYACLLDALDGYAMDIRGLLLGAPRFELDDEGELVIEPKGVLKACERRRAFVRELVSCILDPLAVPVTEEAAAFWLTDSFERRKLFVHRREHAVQQQRGRLEKAARPVARRRDIAAANTRGDLRRLYGELPPPTEARALLSSIWDLDRIYGYLLFETLYPEAPGAVRDLREAAVMEIERFRARRQGRTLMPCHYALGALQGALGALRPGRPGRTEVTLIERGILGPIETLIAQSRPKKKGALPTLDKGGQVRRTIREIRDVLRPRRHATRGGRARGATS